MTVDRTPDGWPFEPTRWLRYGSDVEQRLAPDPDLAEIVQFANAFGLSVNLVLTLPGQVIGGELVGGKQHYAELAAGARSADTDADIGQESSPPENLAKLFEVYGSYYDEFGDGLFAEGDEVPELPHVAFIHLRDAYIVTPRGPVPINHWRGRLESVVGWTLGVLTYSPSESSGAPSD